MTKFFVGLYNYFERHKVLFYLSLSVCILFMALFAAQVRFEENVTSFFPDTKDSQNAINVFENLKIKDKIMIMLSGKDGVADADSLIEAAETIKQDLQQQAEGTLIKEIFSKADENLINSVGDFVYDNLPLFLSDEAYQRLDTLLTAGNIAALMQKNYSNLISPAGFALKNYIMRDPLGLGSQTLKHLQDFQLEANYELINEHIFSRDGSTLLMFITPVFNTGSTGKNDKLIRLISAVFPFRISLASWMDWRYSSRLCAPMQGPLQFLMWYSKQTLNFPLRMFSGVSARWHVRNG